MDLCIYHDSCADGFAAALVVWKKFGYTGRYLPSQYGDAPPDVTGKDVVIVDFSWKRPEMEKMISQAGSLVVLDHHKTALAELEGLPGCYFDSSKSGAMMAWEYFNPDEKPPALIRYVQDRDLWQWELPSSKEISAYLASIPFEFEWWEQLFDDDFLYSHISEGSAILRYQAGQVEKAKKAARMVKFAGYEVPLVNTTHLVSEVVGELAEGHPFAVGYFDVPGQRVYSLRSRTPGGIDVSEIAGRFGGGGHKHAAGFKGKLRPHIFGVDERPEDNE